MSAIVLCVALLGAEGPSVEAAGTPKTRLYVRTVPPGATVTVDGEKIGTSDGLFLVPPGVRKVTIELEGYGPKDLKVDVPEGWIKRVVVELQKRPRSRADALGGPPKTGPAGRSPSADDAPAWPRRKRQMPRAPRPPIQQALARKISLSFADTPLADVVKHLAEELPGIRIQIDHRGLAEVGHAADVPLSVSLKDVSVGTALDLALSQPDLAWTIRHGVLMITSPEEAEKSLLSRVYPVADITSDCNMLIEAITTTIEADSWDDRGGPGSIVPDVAGTEAALVISQTYTIHERIAQLLEDLRSVARQTAEGKSPDSISPAGPDAEAIRRALSQKVPFAFAEVPFSKVCEALGDSSGLNVFVDHRALDEVGIPGDVPITMRIADVELRSALGLLLDPLDLAYHFVDGVLVITTLEEAEYRLSVRVYPVGDLVAQRDYDHLMAMIASTIAPETWDGVGGPGSMAPVSSGALEALVVAQAHPIHDRIAALLADLRKQVRPTRAAIRGARLDFRLAPARGDDKEGLGQQQLKRYVDDLQSKGASSRADQDGEFAWFESQIEPSPGLITETCEGRRYMLLSNRPDETMLAGEPGERTWGLERVSAEKDRRGQPAIGLEFDEAGSRRVAALTGAHPHRYMAILVDDRVVATPMIKSKIENRAQITGDFDEQDVLRLVRALILGMVNTPAPKTSTTVPARVF